MSSGGDPWPPSLMLRAIDFLWSSMNLITFWLPWGSLWIPWASEGKTLINSYTHSLNIYISYINYVQNLIYIYVYIHMEWEIHIYIYIYILIYIFIYILYILSNPKGLFFKQRNTKNSFVFYSPRNRDLPLQLFSSATDLSDVYGAKYSLPKSIMKGPIKSLISSTPSKPTLLPMAMIPSSKLTNIYIHTSKLGPISVLIDYMRPCYHNNMVIGPNPNNMLSQFQIWWKC